MGPLGSGDQAQEQVAQRGIVTHREEIEDIRTDRRAFFVGAAGSLLGIGACSTMARDSSSESRDGDPSFPGSAAYEEAVSFRNLRVTRRPTMVFRPRTLPQVVAAVKRAQKAGKLCVRSGGHGGTTSAIRDGAIMVDMRAMHRVKVDRAARTMSVEGGALNGHVDAAAGEADLLAVTGSCPSVGYTSLLLGGGNTFVSRRFGLAADNLRSCVLVTPQAEVLRVSPSSFPDLWWALRGAGAGNFGIVTEIEIDLHDAGGVVEGGLIAWRPSSLASALTAYATAMHSAPDSFSGGFGIECGPGESGAPAARPFSLCVALDPAAGRRSWGVLRNTENRIRTDVRERSYEDYQEVYASRMKEPRHLVRRSWFLRGSLTPEFCEALASVSREHGSVNLWIGLEPFGGAISRVDPSDSSFVHRDREFLLQVIGSWTSAADNSKVSDALSRFADELGPWLSANAFQSYVDAVESEHPAQRAKACFGRALGRLQKVKDEVDPEGILQGLVAV